MNIYDRRDIGRTGLEIVCTDFVPIIRAKSEGFWTDAICGLEKLYQRKFQGYDTEQYEELERTAEIVRQVIGSPRWRKRVR